jgi:hypothetical protein
MIPAEPQSPGLSCSGSSSATETSAVDAGDMPAQRLQVYANCRRGGRIQSETTGAIPYPYPLSRKERKTSSFLLPPGERLRMRVGAPHIFAQSSLLDPHSCFLIRPF